MIEPPGFALARRRVLGFREITCSSGQDMLALPLPRQFAAPVSRQTGWALFAAFYALSLILQLPGNVPFDGIVVWHEAETATLYAQHPAALVLVWRLLDLIVPGPLLFTAAQLAPLWLAAKVLFERVRAPLWLAVCFYLFLLAWPPLLALSGVTVKDVFGGHLAVLAFVLVLPKPQTPHAPWIWAVAFALATLAALFRYQLALMLPVLALMCWRQLPREGLRSAGAGAIGLVGAWAAVAIGVAFLFTRAGPGDVDLSLRKMMVFDIAGTVAADPAVPLPVLARAGVDVAALKSQMLAAYTPARVDSLWQINGATPLDPMRSGVFALLDRVSNGQLFRQWLFSARHDAPAFLRHHGLAFARVLGFADIYACRPIRAGISPLPTAQAAAVQARAWREPLSAKVMTAHAFPVGLPFRAWLYALLCAAIAGAWLTGRAFAAEAVLLAGFGLVYELSFLVLTQACEVRYSYPLFLAAVFGVALALARRLERGLPA